MSNKTKTVSKNEFVKNLSGNLGVLLMTAATTLGMVEFDNHSKTAITLPNRPVMAFQEENNNNDANNAIRRERDETAPHYISYSESQRTPSRSSKH